jgi:hypothetical protein
LQKAGVEAGVSKVDWRGCSNRPIISLIEFYSSWADAEMENG